MRYTLRGTTCVFCLLVFELISSRCTGGFGGCVGLFKLNQVSARSIGQVYHGWDDYERTRQVFIDKTTESFVVASTQPSDGRTWMEYTLQFSEAISASLTVLTSNCAL